MMLDPIKDIGKFEHLERQLSRYFRAQIEKITITDAIKIFDDISSREIEGHTYTKDPRKSEYRCSGLVSECNRKIVFSSLLNWQSDEYTNIAASGGTLIHEVVQTILQKVDPNFNKDTIEPEANFEVMGIKITGHIDILVINFNINSEEIIFIIDIKTNKNMKWKNRHPEYIIKDYHIDQVTLYLVYYLKNNKHVESDNVYGALWYIERTDNKPDILKVLNHDLWLFHVFRFDQMRFIKLINKAKNITTILQAGMLPLPMPSDFWLCENIRSKCQYYDLCHDEEKRISTVQEMLLLLDGKED